MCSPSLCCTVRIWCLSVPVFLSGLVCSPVESVLQLTNLAESAKAHLGMGSPKDESALGTPTQEKKWDAKAMVDKDKQHGLLSTAPLPKWHPTEKMKAMVWTGKESVKCVDHAKPMIVDSTDALIRITATTICGSDLHMYYNKGG